MAQPHIYRRFAWPAWDRWHWVARLDWFRRRRDARDAAPLLRGRRGTWWHPPWFHVAGVAQPHIYRRFAWPAWDRWHWVARLDGLGAAVTPVTPRHFCVAGVALGDIHLDFTWQAWHNLTSTVVLRGRRGTDGTGVARLDWFRRRRDARDAASLLRGRRGTWWHPPWFHVAGVAQPHIYRRFAWQACVAGVALGDIHLDFTWQAWHNLTSTVVLRGRRGTDGTGWRAWTGLGAAVTPVTPRHFCVAGVALGDIHLDFTWQAWHNLTSTVVLRGRRGTDGTGWRAWTGLGAAVTPVTPRHFCVAPLLRSGTWWHPPWFHVAGVAQPHIYRRFAWQTWDRWHWVARLDWFRRRRDACDAAPLLRGRRGTWWHPPWFHVAGVAQPHIYRRFAWPAWDRWHWVARLDWFRRRRDACDAAPLLRGRRGTWWHPPWFHVAGVAQPHIYHRFAWPAWDRWHWVARLDWFRRRRDARDAAPLLRGRRGTWWRPPWLHARSFCVAGASLMALGDIHLDFTWHAVWHNLTSMTPAVDHDYIPGMITSHRACRKSSQNLRLRPKECRTLLWSAEVWRAHHRFDRGLCHKRSFGKQRREKNHQSLVELEEGEWDTSWDLVFSTHPWIPQRISVVSISCFFSGLQWQVTI